MVDRTLNEIGAGEKPMIVVFNKIDNFTYEKKDEDDLTPTLRENLSLEDLKKRWSGERRDVVFISALKKQNVDYLKDVLYQKVKQIHVKRYPYNDFLY